MISTIPGVDHPSVEDDDDAGLIYALHESQFCEHQARGSRKFHLAESLTRKIEQLHRLDPSRSHQASRRAEITGADATTCMLVKTLGFVRTGNQADMRSSVKLEADMKHYVRFFFLGQLKPRW